MAIEWVTPLSPIITITLKVTETKERVANKQALCQVMVGCNGYHSRLSLSYPEPIYVGGTFCSLLFPPSFFLLLQLLQHQHIETAQHYHFFSVHMSVCEHQHLQKRNGFSASIPVDELAEAGIWL